MEPTPQRLSDADRDAAVAMLRDHFQAGRIDASEFDERMSAALNAKFAGDVEVLFNDLPAPRPDFAGTVVSPFTPAVWTAPPLPEKAQPNKALGIVRALLWPVAIMGGIFVGHWFWWIGGAIIVGIVLGQLMDRQDPPRFREIEK